MSYWQASLPRKQWVRKNQGYIQTGRAGERASLMGAAISRAGPRWYRVMILPQVHLRNGYDIPSVSTEARLYLKQGIHMEDPTHFHLVCERSPCLVATKKSQRQSVDNISTQLLGTVGASLRIVHFTRTLPCWLIPSAVTIPRSFPRATK